MREDRDIGSENWYTVVIEVNADSDEEKELVDLTNCKEFDSKSVEIDRHKHLNTTMCEYKVSFPDIRKAIQYQTKAEEIFRKHGNRHFALLMF